MKKVAIITGAAGGIGWATALKLLELGFRVCATDRDQAPLQKLADKLLPQQQNHCLPAQLDVLETHSIRKVQELVLKQWGRIDILVNNAGIFELCDFSKITEESFRKVMDTNFTGAFRTTQIFSESMMKQKSGKIINISSIAGNKGAPRSAHYAASKGALNALSLSLAVELAPYNIQVNVVQPGFIDTPMMINGQRDQMKRIAAWRIPSRRLGKAWEVAETIGYLASSESNYFTGAQILIDGGFSLG